MKILVINLLRIGDVLATLPAIKRLRMENPTAQIHLMINSSCAHMTGILGSIDRVFLFERDRLQKSLVEAERPLLEAFDDLRSFLDQVNEEQYDRVINFTHNRLSGWLTGLIEAPLKQGLVLDGVGGVSFGGPWFRFLNNQVDFDSPFALHHTDIFFGAVGGWEEEKWTGSFDDLLMETPRGRAEVQSLVEFGRSKQSFGPRIAVQLSTSDSKKEWGDDSFFRSILRLSEGYSGLTVFVLGAPQEMRRINAFCARFENLDSACALNIVPSIVSLEGAVTLLEECDLLLTGDTSMKHLGAATSVPVVELILGSADAYRTGGWKQGDVMISSREVCAPCGATEPCHRDTHACANGISSELVSAVMRARIENQNLLSKHWREFLTSVRSRADVLLVDRSLGIVQPLSVFQELNEISLSQSIERVARRIGLEMTQTSLDRRDRSFASYEFGSEIHRLGQMIRRRYFAENMMEVRHMVSNQERQLRHTEGLLRTLKTQISNDPNRILESVRACTATKALIKQSRVSAFVVEALESVIEDDRSSAFTRVRKMLDAVEDLEVRLAITLKLCRGLELELENDPSDYDDVLRTENKSN